MKKLGIVGAGGFAREVLWLLEEMGLSTRVDAFYESDAVWQERVVWDRPVLPISRFNAASTEAVIALGSPSGRRQLVSELPSECSFPTLIHPGVLRSKRLEIGPGTIICAGSILTCDVHVGAQVHLNLATTVGHDCRIHPYVTTAPSVNISGGCEIGEATYIGTNACLREGLTIAGGSTIGMGAVVVSSIATAAVYVGNPARRLERA